MDMLRAKNSSGMDALFQTGYPHAINLFAALILTLLPLLSPFSGEAGADLRPPMNYGLSIGLALLYLALWSRLRVFQPERSPRFYRWYLIAQTVVVALIYALDGGLTRFLFVVVAVQAVYISPVRRWAPFLGTLAALWLTLYLAISPDPGSMKVSTIGMYLCYLIFAALVTFTTVQQERQNQVAHQLLDGVDRRYHTLRAYDLTVEHRTEMEERERLAKTICATLLSRLAALMEQLEQLKRGAAPFNGLTARTARLQAKEVLGAVREAVRTLRPGEDGELDDESEGDFGRAPQPEVSVRWTDPIRVYHVWNIGVIVVTTGVIVASSLVGRTAQWAPLLGAGLALLAIYGLAATARQPWNRTLYLVLQAGLITWMVDLSMEPLMNHLFLIIAAQTVFLVPPVRRWLAATVLFPTLLSAIALSLTHQFSDRIPLLMTLTAAFAVTNFFGAVTAYMTRRQVEARKRAVIYAQQLAEVNRLLEVRLQEIRRMAIARERVRMAREIHDGLGHHLTIVIMELQYVEALADEDRPGAIEHIENAQRVIQAAMATSREMVETLEEFDRPLEVAVKDLIMAWQKGNPAKVLMRVSGDFSHLSTAARITLYRAVQESLTNIQKHARARHVEIDLRQLPGRVSLAVTNDGAGGVPRIEVGRSGFGLLGLKERADALHGDFSAGAGPSGGFQVKLDLPLGV